jgi:hypothetical protein
MAVTLTAPLIAGGLLLLAPDLIYYRGASGMAVMLVVLAACTLWTQSRVRARVALALLGVALTVKIGAEALGYTTGWSDLPAGVHVAWQAHLLGVSAAILTIQAVRVR